jgi:ATP-dependent DNA helicase RecG
MLLSTVKLDDLVAGTGVHESRNPLISRVLREVGFVREMGEGVRQILEVMRSNALAEPQFLSDTTGFRVVLSNRSLYPEDVRLWLSNFDDFGLTEEQRAVMALGYQGRTFSTQDVIDRLGIVDTGQVQEILTPLRSLGLLERTATHQALITQARRRGIPKRAMPSLRVADASNWQRPHERLEGRVVKGQAVAAMPDRDTSAVDVGDTDESTFLEVVGLPTSSEQSVELFLGNLAFETTRQEVTALLQDHDDVLQVTLPSYRGGPRNRGYGFATVNCAGDPRALIAKLDGRRLGGRRVHVRFARRGGLGDP